MKRSTFIGMGALALCALLTAGFGSTGPVAAAQGDSRSFPETGHTVRGPFLQYWQQHGGLAQQGYPLTEELQEVSDTNGTTYTMQYFERAVFELHPENAAPYNVQLSLLGVFGYGHRYGVWGVPNQHPSTENPRYFPQTRHTLGGTFRTYWEQHGGLAQQGYPLSEEFQEVSALNGQTYTVQYFQRAVFERHPENVGTPAEVLLSQLGTFRQRDKYQNLVIPAPGAGRVQLGPRGSASYLVWTEGTPGQVGSQDILGVNLQTNQPLTIANGLGDQSTPAIAGSLVVWEDHGCGPTCGGSDIMGKDLATGTTFPVAVGANYQTRPTIAGRSVAWLELSSDSTRLMVQSLDGGPLTIVATLPLTQGQSDGPTFGEVALSDTYIAWSEVAPRNANRLHPWTLRIMNRVTQRSNTVVAGVLSPSGTRPQLALSDHQLVWTLGGVQITDLQSGATRALFTDPASDPVIQGDVLVWISQSSLWGVQLPSGTARQLAANITTATSVTLAGGWLVWQNAGGPQDGRLTARRLAEVFVGR